jgi:hypothetical protein
MAAGCVKRSGSVREKPELSQQLVINHDHPVTPALLTAEICRKRHFAQLLGL